jgi:chromosome segregation ATPase
VPPEARRQRETCKNLAQGSEEMLNATLDSAKALKKDVEHLTFELAGSQTKLVASQAKRDTLEAELRAAQAREKKALAEKDEASTEKVQVAVKRGQALSEKGIVMTIRDQD